MTTTTMHFGPEWMRTKGSARPAPSPPLATSPAAAGISTYSALVAPAANSAPEHRDTANPFHYSKDEMLRVYKEGGGKGGLGLEVERWDGIVREVGSDPVGMKEMSESEKKLFAGSLNSEMRRRPSTDVLSPLTTSLGDRPKIGHATSAAGSPMRERIGNLMNRRRDSTDQQPLAIPRKLSLSSMQSGTLASPRDTAMPSPRPRIGATPGFEGVLGESWTSRRRGDSLSKPGADRRERESADAQGPDIKEEDEDKAQQGGHIGREEPQTNGVGKNVVGANSESINSAMAGLVLDNHDRAASFESSTADQLTVPVSKSPGLADPSDIEWSYLDPQGQVQGPFRADLMQHWHNEGYFTPDLLMRRTHLDTEWTSVGEMARRAGSNPIFLTPGVTSSAPPGLPRRQEPLLDGPSPGRNSPLQPVPTVSRRSSTLESCLHNGSSASSASPSSSFGGSRHLNGNGSPDPSAFDGRPTSNIYGEHTGGPRLATLASMPSVSGQRRSALNGPFDTSAGMRTSLSHAGGLSRGLDGIGLNGMTGIGAPAAGQIGQYPSGLEGLSSDVGAAPPGPFGNPAGLGGLRGALEMPLGDASSSAFGGTDQSSLQNLSMSSTPSRTLNRDMYNKPSGECVHSSAFGASAQSGNDMPYSPGAQLATQPQSFAYSSSQDNRSLSMNTPLVDRLAAAPTSPLAMNQHHVSSPVRTAPAPQWPPQSGAVRRPGPFDHDYPTASNTIITGTSTMPHLSYGHSTHNISTSDQSSWGSISQPRIANGWGGATSSLTVENLGQHNQQQDATIPTAADTASVTNDVQPTAPDDAQVEAILVETAVSMASPSPVEPSRASQKSRRKSTAPSAAVPSPAVTKASTTPFAPNKPPSPVPAPALPSGPDQKAAWGADDEAKKTKPSGNNLGLREIQEAEMRKLEARKAAERERERVARIAAGATSQPEEFQSFTTSWGLPTSQAGVARPSPTSRDSGGSSTPAAVTTSTLVWTNAAKTVAKKTMKEIQEEEERRKKLASKEKETVAAAAKRAHADTTKPSTPVVQASGGAWTTVGSGGKTAVATPATVRPVGTPSTYGKAAPSISAATGMATASVVVRAAPTSAPSPRPVMPTKAASSKVDDFPTPPSQDFMKWMSDSLKGLNSSVNFEEITSMLLTFPLDPDSSTVEIISDLIYASSTTLDGRRFASEFVNRRKADAAARGKNGTPTGPSAKSLSIAEVVKAQPKPTQQSEWGGFKVVNKKKKGGRA